MSQGHFHTCLPHAQLGSLSCHGIIYFQELSEPETLSPGNASLSLEQKSFSSKAVWVGSRDPALAAASAGSDFCRLSFITRAGSGTKLCCWVWRWNAHDLSPVRIWGQDESLHSSWQWEKKLKACSERDGSHLEETTGSLLRTGTLTTTAGRSRHLLWPDVLSPSLRESSQSPFEFDALLPHFTDGEPTERLNDLSKVAHLLWKVDGQSSHFSAIWLFKLCAYIIFVTKFFFVFCISVFIYQSIKWFQNLPKIQDFDIFRNFNLFLKISSQCCD